MSLTEFVNKVSKDIKLQEVLANMQGVTPVVDTSGYIKGITGPDKFDASIFKFRGKTRTPEMVLAVSCELEAPIATDGVRAIDHVSRLVRLSECGGTLHYGMLLTPESLLKKNNLADIINVRYIAKTINPSNMNHPGEIESFHNLELTSSCDWLEIDISGRYRRAVRSLVQRLNPNLVGVMLSGEDISQLKAYKTSSLSRRGDIKFIEHLFKYNQQGIGLTSTRQEEIVPVWLPPFFINKLDRLLDTSILDVNESAGTGVVALFKSYSLLDRLRGTRLKELRYLTDHAQVLDLGVNFGSPLITKDEAKAMYLEHFETIVRLCDNPKNIAPAMTLVRYYAGIQMGSPSSLVQYDTFKLAYGPVLFLTSRGYTPEIFEGSKDYQETRHLLSWLIQDFKRNPETLVRNLVERCVNLRNAPVISGVSSVTTSDFRKISLPDNGELRSVVVTSGDDKECLVLQMHDSGKLELYSMTRLDNPTLLRVQEVACRFMGFTFEDWNRPNNTANHNRLDKSAD